MPPVAIYLILALEEHGLFAVLRNADHTAVCHQEIGEGVGIAGGNGVVVVIVGVVGPAGEQADGQNAAECGRSTPDCAG